MGALTKLQAVNRMLRAASEYPVSTLSGSEVNSSLIAEALLDETVLQIQLQGLDANFTIKSYDPDVDGIIWLPSNTVTADGWDAEYGRRFSVRGQATQYLYNMDDDTDVFDDSVTLRVVRSLSFDDLETPHQYWAADSAAYVYHGQTSGDPNESQLLLAIATQSRMKARAHDIRQKQSSMLASDPWLAQGAFRDTTAWFNQRTGWF